MTTEDAFLTTLNTAQRWRLDDKNRLIIEGEAGRLLLTTAPRRPTRNHRRNPNIGRDPLRGRRRTGRAPVPVPASQIAVRTSARASPTGRSRSPGSSSSPIRPACSIGRSRACSRSPTCISRKARLRRARRAAAALRHRGDAGRLALLIARYAPRVVVALGDSFHDGRGPARLADTDRAALKALQRGRDWVWIAGNHDPDPAENIGGRFLATLQVGALTFRHEPTGSRRGRDRRPSASGGAGRPARPRGQPPLLCQRPRSAW